MNLTIEVPWDIPDLVIKEIEQIENVTEVKEISRNSVKANILERKPNNQIEIIELVIKIVVSAVAKETYEFTKKKILDHLNKKKIKVKKANYKKK